MQKGFATLEVILMVMVIGILASIAVPRFTSVTTAANTAKIQSDLSTIDTAIAVYQMEKGTDPSADVNDLVKAGYLQSKPEPPSGSCYYEGSSTPKKISEFNATAGYTIGDVTVGEGNSATKVKRAVLGTDNTAEKFHLPTTPTTPTTPTEDQ